MLALVFADWWIGNRCSDPPRWWLISLICNNSGNTHTHRRQPETLMYYITNRVCIRLVDAFVIFYHCMLVRSRTTVLLLSSSPSLPRRHHGALGQGAFPQLHDRLNHRAADVAVGENVPGLKRAGETRMGASMTTEGLAELFLFRRGDDEFLLFHHVAAGLVKSAAIPVR